MRSIQLQSRYGYRTREELETIARTFRARGLPCDALILDLYWFAQMGDLAFNPAAWPNPAEMINRLSEQGFRVIVIEEPYITEQSASYAQAQAGGYLAKHYDGAPYTLSSGLGTGVDRFLHSRGANGGRKSIAH